MKKRSSDFIKIAAVDKAYNVSPDDANWQALMKSKLNKRMTKHSQPYGSVERSALLSKNYYGNIPKVKRAVILASASETQPLHKVFLPYSRTTRPIAVDGEVMHPAIFEINRVRNEFLFS